MVKDRSDESYSKHVLYTVLIFFFQLKNNLTKLNPKEFKD